MEEEKINYRALRKIQETEKNSPILTGIASDFYENLNDLIENLNNRLEKETAQQKQMLLNEEIQNTKKIAASIYEQREKKILLAAISKARGGNPELKNMIEGEKELYDSVVEIMLVSRQKFLEKKKEEEKEIETIRDNEEKTEEISIQQSKIIEKEEPEDTKIEQKNKNPIVRIIKDIPEFIGTDEKKYSLKNNDVLSLPEDMVEMLLKRGVAERIEK